MNNCWIPRDSNWQSSFCAYFVSTAITGAETSVGEMHITNRRHKLDMTSTRKMGARWPTVGSADPIGQPSPGGAHSSPSTSTWLVCAPELPLSPACFKIQLKGSYLLKNAKILMLPRIKLAYSLFLVSFKSCEIKIQIGTPWFLSNWLMWYD